MRPLAVIVGAGKIGRAIAEHLDKRGYAIALGAHHELELVDPESVERFFGLFENIAVLVNAAGSYGTVGSVRATAPQAWRRAIDVNLVGVYAACHHAVARMAAGSHIVNIGGGGKGPMELRSGYAAAKSALWRLTETLAAEEPELHVNAIAPGPMWSRMQEAVASLPEMRSLAAGRGEVPVRNTLRVVDWILDTRPTGQLFFARQFGARPVLASVK